MARMLNKRDQLLAELATGIGGSELHNLWSLEPYGCRRKLWYEKRKVPPDFQRVTSPDMERGTCLEEVVARKYRQETGRRLSAGGFWRHPTEPHLIVHPDRIIQPLVEKGADQRVTPGVLEIKCPSVRHFLKIKREGIPHSWNLQLQQGLAITGHTWGAFAVFSAELWDLTPVEVDYDRELYELIRQEGSRFWREVEHGPAPDRLAPDDHRCQTCAFRTSCQGEALRARLAAAATDGEELPRDDSLAPLVRDYVSAKALADDVKEMVEVAKGRLEAAIGDRPRVRAEESKLYFDASERSTLDAAGLRAEHPEIAQKFERRSIVRSLRVYPVKP